MPDEDDDLFCQAMQDVRRLEIKKHRVAPTQHLPRIRIDGPIQQVPEGETSDLYPAPEQTGEPWVLKSDGVSQERLRQLASGRMKVDAELDLHGMTREEAYKALGEHLSQLTGRGGRVLCVVHGRGLHSRGGRSVLREAVYQWLADGPYAGRVLAVTPAPATGGGSCLVLLRRRRVE